MLFRSFSLVWFSQSSVLLSSVRPLPRLVQANAPMLARETNARCIRLQARLRTPAVLMPAAPTRRSVSAAPDKDTQALAPTERDAPCRPAAPTPAPPWTRSAFRGADSHVTSSTCTTSIPLSFCSSSLSLFSLAILSTRSLSPAIICLRVLFLLPTFLR